MSTRIRWGRVFGAIGSIVLVGIGMPWLLAAKPSVENQVWLERLPRNDRDRILSLVFVAPKDSAERIGAVQQASFWMRHAELFRYGIVGKKARLVFPQDGEAVVLELKAYACEGRAPEPFTLCLDLTDATGETWTLYSHEDFAIPDLATQPELPYDPDAETGPSRLEALLR